MEDIILEKLENTTIVERIKQIIILYDELEEKQKKFCSTFDIHCGNGCGECCEHFTPDISEVEALFLAYGLIKEGKDEEVLNLLHSKDPTIDNYCPLYNKDNIYHCSVYKFRPLVCRLFGASASLDKERHCVFRKCKYNAIGHDVSSDEFEQNRNLVVLMSDYGEAINEIEPTDMNRELLPIALEKAINKIKYILELEG